MVCLNLYMYIVMNHGKHSAKKKKNAKKRILYMYNPWSPQVQHATYMYKYIIIMYVHL